MVWTSSGHPISSLKLPPVASSANRHENDPGGAIGGTIAVFLNQFEIFQASRRSQLNQLMNISSDSPRHIGGTVGH